MNEPTTPNPTLQTEKPPITNAGKWLVLAAAFLGWMFDGLEMGVFPQIARPAISQLVPEPTPEGVKSAVSQLLADTVRIEKMLKKVAEGTKDKKPPADSIPTAADVQAALQALAAQASADNLKQDANTTRKIDPDHQTRNPTRDAAVFAWDAALENQVKKWHQIIDACFLFGAALGGLVFGWLGDKIGRVRAMAMSILVYSLFTGVLYFVTAPAQIAVLRFIAAIGMGGEWALGVALIMEVWDAKYRPILAGLIGAASNVGFVLVGAIGVAWPVTQSSWRFVALVGLLPAVLFILIQIFVPESHKWQESQKKAPSKPLRELFSDRKLSVLAVMAICFASVALLGTWGAVQKIPAWVKDLSGADKYSAGVTQIASGFGAILSCLGAPLLAARFNRRIAYFILCLGSLASCLALFGLFHTYNFGFVAMTFLVGGMSAAFYGWLPLYLPELFPTRVRATAQGIAFNFGRVLAGAGAIWGGLIGGSYARMGLIVSMVYIVGMVIIWFAPETKGKPLPE